MPVRQRHVALALLADQDFLALWVAGSVLNIMRWLEILAIGVFVYRETGDPLLVTLIQAVRWLPLVLFGGAIGARAERLRRKPPLVVGYISAAAVSTGLAVASILGAIDLWLIALGAFLMGVVWSGDYGLRRTFLGEVAGNDRLTTGMALDSVTVAITRMLGPLAGGLLIAFIGLHGAYFAGTLLYGAAALLLALRLREALPAASGPDESAPERREPTGWGPALRHLRANPTVAGVLYVTIVFNMLGAPYFVMIPVLGKEVLNLTPEWLGLLQAADGLGALLGVLLATTLGERMAAGPIFVRGTLIFFVGVVLFALSESWLLSATLLFGAGFGFAGFASMQSGLVLRHSAEAYRRRMMGMLATCIGCAPLGMLLLGMVARAFGAAFAVSLLAGIGVLALILGGLAWRWLSRKGA